MPVTKRLQPCLRLKIGIFFSLSLPLLVSACDPGFRLRPKGWQAVADDEWVKRLDDFEIQTRGIKGLIGEASIEPDLRIYNNTKSITVESAELRTAEERFNAEIYDNHPIPPSPSGYHLPISWKAGPKVLGDHCEIILTLKVDREVRRITIEYVK